jgi:hypothetical protein
MSQKKVYKNLQMKQKKQKGQKELHKNLKIKKENGSEINNIIILIIQHLRDYLCPIKSFQKIDKTFFKDIVKYL